MSTVQQSDVTGTVDLSDPVNVADAVCRTYMQCYPGHGDGLLRQAFDDIEDAFWGRYPGLLACDTPYHDLHHSLDTALLMSRMVHGYARSRTAAMPRLGADEGMLAILLALYHDIGFLRRSDEGDISGASLLREHEQRGVDFMRAYLAAGPLAHLAARADLIQTTNFAVPLDGVLRSLPDEFALIGRMLGTADLVCQVAGRYYLERCRFFLYKEFVIAGADRVVTADGKITVLYDSPEELLRKTPGFCEGVVKKRIEDFGEPYRCVAAHFDGDDPYQRGMQRNIDFLKELIERGDFSPLGRQPVPLMPDAADAISIALPQ